MGYRMKMIIKSHIKQFICLKINCFCFIICLSVVIHFLFNHRVFSQSLSSANKIEVSDYSIDDLQAHSSIDDLNHHQLTEVLEFCRTNDQASDLCYLLAEDVIDYSDLGYDLQIDHSFSDYAQSVGVVSVPVFLRYLPALSKLAKNNMIVTTAMAIVAAAIIFKKYYDSFSQALLSQTLMIKAEGVDGSSTLLGLEEVKSSKSFKYYSRKGPEHEDDILVPFLQRQAHSEEQKDKKLLVEFKRYVKSVKEWDASPHSSEYADLKIENTNLKEVMELLDDDVDFVLVHYIMKEIDGDDLSVFEKKFAQSVSIRAFDETKLTASTSTFYDTFKRSEWYKEAKILHQELYTERANSLISHIGVLLTNRLKPSEVLKAISPSMWSEPYSVRKIWDVLLLERLSHLQLLESMKDPEFEEKFYLPFLAKLQEKSIDDQIKEIVDEINIQKIEQYADQSVQQTTESIAIAPSLEASSDLDSALLSNRYLDFRKEKVSAQQLTDYVHYRNLMLVSMEQIVQDRVSVWKRHGVYKFLPGEAKSDQALAQWTKLFELATHPLLYELYELSDIYVYEFSDLSDD